MTGLIDTFWRHFLVLTNFIRNEVKSRPYWPGGGERSGTSEAGPGRPEAWSGWVPELGRALQSVPPTPAPVGASGARFAVRTSAFQGAGWTRYSLPLPTRYTHPGYPPGTIPHPYTSPPHHTGHPSHVLYSTFWDTVGEPRGSRTQPVSRVRDRLYTVIYRYTGLHGRLTGFSLRINCFTEVRTCFTEV